MAMPAITFLEHVVLSSMVVTVEKLATEGQMTNVTLRGPSGIVLQKQRLIFLLTAG